MDFYNRVRDFLRRPSLENLIVEITSRLKKRLIFTALLIAAIASI